MNGRSTEPFISTYLHLKGRKLGLPIAGNFELTARCNFNCPMCYVHMTEEQVAASGKELTAAQWLDIARQAKERGMIFALLTGGEPLMRKDFFEIYQGMKEMGLLISINTNGSMISGPVLERFLQDPPCRFNISLYGGSNETYRNMCGRPAYDQVKENIRALRQAGVSVSLNLSITENNRGDLKQIYADAVELGVNVRASNYMYPPVRVNGEQYGCGYRMTAEEAAKCGVEWDLLRFSEEEFAQRAQGMERLADLDLEGCPMEEGEGIRCRAGTSSFWVTWDGRMLPCGMMTQPSIDLMELGFEAAWDQLRAVVSGIRSPAACSSCSHKEVCGVCAAMCLTETGRFDGVPEYVCEKAQHTVRLTKQAFAERKAK